MKKQVKFVFLCKMQKIILLFPLSLLMLLLVQCSSFMPKPYYAGMENQVSYHQEIMDSMKTEIQKFYGAPYKWGGDSPKGTDCSGMIKTIYEKAADISLPHNTQQMFDGGKKIHKIDLLFGDLVFFSNNGHNATHMGLYITNGYFLHASSSNGVVLSRLSERYYKRRFIGARRIEIY